MSKMRQKNKEFFWKIVGPYCRRCGYNECTSALQLHHLDSSQKMDNGDCLGRWLAFSRYELVKKLSETSFTIFCANCHFKLHSVLHKRKVHLNPVDVTVFIEMEKCMEQVKRSKSKRWPDLVDDIDWESIEKGELKEEKEDLERYKARESREEKGIECDLHECGFCGIEKLFPKEYRK